MSSSAAVTPPETLTVWFDGPVPVLKLPERLAFEPLRRWLRSVIPAQLDVLGGRTARLDLGQRDLALFDIRRLVHGLEEEFGISITGLHTMRDKVVRFSQRELKLKLFLHDEDDTHDGAVITAMDRWTDPEPARRRRLRTRGDEWRPVPVEPPQIRERSLKEPTLPTPDADGRKALPVFRTLRSGSQVRFDGHIYVYGDVNPGAQVVATGHIVVLGALKGVAHAGAHGDESSFILAFSMRPTQLRIGRHLTVEPIRSGPQDGARLATVMDQEIRVRPYAGRIRH